MWHQWIPKKVNTLLWLLHTEGLPLGSWLTKIGVDGSCKLCLTAPIETARHAFIDCPIVSRAWVQYNILRDKHDLPQLQFMPEDILEGASPNRAGLERLKYNNLCIVTKETPWDILRCMLIRNIWCQRCSIVIRGEAFHLGTAMHGAWRTTIQIGVATWQGIRKKDETTPRTLQIFDEVWASSPAFCTVADTPSWNFIPGNDYLPRDLASRPSTIPHPL